MNKPKLPKLSRGAKARTESGQSKAPKFLSDLYRDLADRRLLLPLVGLLVAIVAVPLLLSSSPEPAAPAAAPPADLGEATALDAAVVVSDPGIRSYRERLAALKARNPFEPEGSAPASSGGGGATGGKGGSSEGSATTSTSSTTATSSASSSAPSGSSTAITTDTSTDTTVETAGGSTDTTTDTTTDETITQTRFYTGSVDVKVGPLGDAKKLENVHDLNFLPSEKAPVVSFLGLAAGPDQALFSVNPGVIESSGDGSCAPKAADGCQYLTLKVGQERRFKYGSGDKVVTYRLKLRNTHIVRAPDPRDDRTDAETVQQGAPE